MIGLGIKVFGTLLMVKGAEKAVIFVHRSDATHGVIADAQGGIGFAVYVLKASLLHGPRHKFERVEGGRKLVDSGEPVKRSKLPSPLKRPLRTS